MKISGHKNEKDFYKYIRVTPQEAAQKIKELREKRSEMRVFDPSEKINIEKSEGIANRYMEKIGSGKQPYLVYRHNDAGHPHIHFVSTNIQKEGSIISLHNLGKNQSEKAQKKIEIESGLVKASNGKQTNLLNNIPVNAQRIIYGKSESKRAFANVLMKVVFEYKFTSFSALNAVLKLYNVTADKGEKG